MLWNVQREVTPAFGARVLLANGGRAATIGVGEDNEFRGFSDTVRIETSEDPTGSDGDDEDDGQGRGDESGQGQGSERGKSREGEGGQGQGGERGQGRGNREDGVVRITSLPKAEDTDDGGDEDEQEETSDDSREQNDDEAVTFDYGISVVNVRNRNLTVRDIYEYEPDGDEGRSENEDRGDDEEDNGDEADGTESDDEADEDTEQVDSGFVYDWLVTDEDVTGVGTDHEMESVGPDEAWLLLQTGETEETETATDTPTDDPNDGTETGTPEPEPSVVDGFTLVFRTMYADREPGAWHTRTVTDEFRGIDDQPWKRFSQETYEFVPVGFDLLEAYGDATVHAVGVGRGDPFYGPSKLDTYYRDLFLNGERYDLPVTYATDRGRSDEAIRTQ